MISINGHYVIFDLQDSVEVIKVLVKESSKIATETPLLHLRFPHCKGGRSFKWKSNVCGTVAKLFVKEGSIISKGTPVLQFYACDHPIVLKDLCAECGADLRNNNNVFRVETGRPLAEVSVLHSIPELMITQEEALQLGRSEIESLKSERKLVLLVDLDQTLLETTDKDVDPNDEEVCHYQLWNKNRWFHTKFRPGVFDFLKRVSVYYQLHIFTFGERLYAHTIASMLDPDKIYFYDRILSRNECFNQDSKTANLKTLFPCGDEMVGIIDDRDDVWHCAPNLIKVRPYEYFNSVDTKDRAPSVNKRPISCSDDDLDIQHRKKSRCEINSTADDAVRCKCNDNALEKNSLHEELPACGELVNVPAKAGCDKAYNKKNEPLHEFKSGSKRHSPDDCIPFGKNGYKKAKFAVSKDKCSNYLSDIADVLCKIHKIFYEQYDKHVENSKVPSPDLKLIIPAIKKSILLNVCIAFSGVIPNQCEPKSHRIYLMSQSLGAEITDDVVPGKTTHCISGKPRTSKTKLAYRSNILVVTPNWLIDCMFHWRRLPEKDYELKDNFDLPVDCPFFYDEYVQRKKTCKAKDDFLNAGLIDEMNAEVDEVVSSDEDLLGDDVVEQNRIRKLVLCGNDCESDDEELNDYAQSLNEDEYPRGWHKSHNLKRGVPFVYMDDNTDEEESTNERDSVQNDDDNSSCSSSTPSINSYDEELAEAVQKAFFNE